jgi:predicted neutral ceramidase superfamily lipid hydrolase
MHGFNPVGYSGLDYTNIVKEVIQEAVNNLEDIEVGSAKKAIKINIVGKGSTLKLTSTIYSTISLLKILFPATMIVMGLVCAIVIALF